MNLEDAKKKIEKELYKLRCETREGISRISVEVEHCNPLFWLKAQDFQKGIYWKSRNSDFVCAGVEEAVSVKGELPFSYRDIFLSIKKSLIMADSGVRFYGGMRFPVKKRNSEWKGFGDFYFFVPMFELITKGSKNYFVCNVKTPIRDIDVILKRLFTIRTNFDSEQLPISGSYLSREDLPDKKQWKDEVKDVVEQIKKGKLIKVVLARRSSFKLKDSFNVLLLLADPRWKREKTYHFFIKPSPYALFLSMSPERIYFRKGDSLETEAIAGTRKRGASGQEDEALSLELRKSKKELTEHRLVSELLKKKLESICTVFSISEKESLLKLSYMQHLYTKFTGRLKKGVSDSDIISTLYPNPAIAGHPLKDALKKIEEVEEFDRGWYSGPFGWIARDCAEFVVSIRSGLFTGDVLHLYSGAGIVSESNPDMEWEELNYKIQNFTSFLKHVSS